VKPWPDNCPVCGDELPPRGARRLYVPWRRGFRRVHAGACAEAIEAQGVLDLAPPKPRPALVEVWAVRYRAALAAYPVELSREALDRFVARHRLLVPALQERGVGEEDVERARERREELVRYARWYLAHAREYSGWPGQVLA
jgi:hypothetical protein